MKSKTKIGAGIGVGAAALLAATAIAVASPTSSGVSADDSTPNPSTSASATPQVNALSGSAAQSAIAAAQDAVPGGTVVWVGTDRDGGYRAQVVKSDGTRVTVSMDSSFAVSGVDESQGRGGKGGPGGGDADGDRPGRGTEATGASAEKATAAAKAAVDGTVERVMTDGDGYKAMVRKSDGTMVLVTMDSSFKVTGTDELPARGGSDGTTDGKADGSRGGHGPDGSNGSNGTNGTTPTPAPSGTSSTA